MKEIETVKLYLAGKEIRTLYESEIDCRIGQALHKTQSVSILLYKNARVDMAFLDELVGAENWQRDHKEIKGNLYCGVGININGSWTWKWDCGVESNTEKEKGEASDSFKRACVNWGVGRELYTAPRIYIPCSKDEWNDGKPRLDLSVARITYNANREIDELIIEDDLGNVRYDRKAKKSYSAAPKEKVGQSTTAAVKPAEPAPKRIVTIAAIKEGKASRLIEQLSKADPDDFVKWELAVAQLRNENPTLDFDFGAMEEIEKLAIAKRNS